MGAGERPDRDRRVPEETGGEPEGGQRETGGGPEGAGGDRRGAGRGPKGDRRGPEGTGGGPGGGLWVLCRASAHIGTPLAVPVGG